MTKFKKKYGVIPNVSDRDYFTNSIHVPVWKEIDPIEKINIESQLTGYSSAGCITYVEIGDNAKYNLDSLKELVLYAKNKDIPYFALNLPLSRCTECGSCCRECSLPCRRHMRRARGWHHTVLEAASLPSAAEIGVLQFPFSCSI